MAGADAAREAAKAVRPTARNVAALRRVGDHALRGGSRGAATIGVVSQRLRPRVLVAPAATHGSVARVVGRGGLAVGAGFVAAEVLSSFRAEGRLGRRTRRVAGRGVGGLAGAVAGAKLGGGVGAAVGTAILPGAGTVVGGFVGAVGGAFIGSAAGQRLGGRLADTGERVGRNAGAVADAVRGAVSALNPFD